jgi:DNA mismatch endonuclease, patch repair protein
MDNLSMEQRRKNMQAIRSFGTKTEVLLAKTLWAHGYRYRKNDKTVFGKPDFTFKKYKIAIFIDSEYFHGKNWHIQKHRIKTNQEYWWKKIDRNILRDKLVSRQLKQEGWVVIRMWSKDVQFKLSKCVEKIERFYKIQEKHLKSR